LFRLLSAYGHGYSQQNFEVRSKVEGKIMAELPGLEELHTVDNAEADAVFEYCKHAIPHNEMLGRLIRNMYGRLQVLEKEVVALKKAIQRDFP
jgi:hypothetical protein